MEPAWDPVTLLPGGDGMGCRGAVAGIGPVEAVVGGRLVDLGPPKQRALFGLLLTRVDRPAAATAALRTPSVRQGGQATVCKS